MVHSTYGSDRPPAPPEDYPVPADGSDTEETAEVIELGQPGKREANLASIRLGRLATDFVLDPDFDAASMPIPLTYIEGVKLYLTDPAVTLANWPPVVWNQKPRLLDVMRSSRLDGRIDELEEHDPVSQLLVADLVRASRQLPHADSDVISWRTLLLHLYRLRLDELDHTGKPESDPQWEAILAKVSRLTPDGV